MEKQRRLNLPHLSRKTYVELMFALQTLHREFSLLGEKILEEIEDLVVEFFDQSENSRVKPRTVVAVLVHHFSKNLHPTTTGQICKVFEVNSTWLRRKRRSYLNQLGLVVDNPALSQHYTHEWRSFPSLVFSNNSVFDDPTRKKRGPKKN